MASDRNENLHSASLLPSEVSLPVLVYTQCAAAICQRDHFFQQYRRNTTADNLNQYRAARKQCKATLHEAKSRYASHVRDSIARQKLDSKDFWRIYNSVMNRNKSTIPALNSSDSKEPMATSSAKKGELLCIQFCKNSSTFCQALSGSRSISSNLSQACQAYHLVP